MRSFPFLSFLVCFFHTTRFLFTSVRYRSVATARCPPYFMHSSSSLKRRTLPHQARVDAHEAIASCLFAHSSSAMASICFTLFTSSMSFPSAMTIATFLTAHLPEFRLWSPSFPTHPNPSPVPVSQKQPRVLKLELELELDYRRCRVDFSTFKFHHPRFSFIIFPSLWVGGVRPSLSAMSCCVTFFTFLFHIQWTPLPSLLPCRVSMGFSFVWLSS